MKRRTRIKICGITRAEDARVAVSCGVDAIGLNFVRGARREIDIETAAEIAESLPLGIEPVAVFQNSDIDFMLEAIGETGANIAQLHGDETPECLIDLGPTRSIKAFAWSDGLEQNASAFASAVRAGGGKLVAFLIDAPRGRGGEGVEWDWSKVKTSEFAAPVFLAGGLTPDNVGAAVRALRPYGVDVASGVESAPGIKDERLIAAFVEAVRAADED